VIRSYGQAGLQQHVRGHVALAADVARWVDADPRLVLAAPPSLGLVCFRHVGGDARTQQLVDELNEEGSMYLTHTRLDGAYTARLAIGGVHTQRHHVEQAWRRIRVKAHELAAHEEGSE
jgi:aromatic-L-amino-acid/L-tryptophan decarboxylase